MSVGIHITRRALTILATAAVAAVSAPAALADPPQGHRAQTAGPDLIERYVASGRGQADVVERWVDGRAGHPDLLGPQMQASATPPTTSVDEGFGWNDAGIGALAGFALSLAAGGALLAVRGRSRMAHS